MHNKVSIIIPSYSKTTKPYLDLCMASIRHLHYAQSLIDVVISTPIGYVPYTDETRGSRMKVVHHPDPNRQFAEAVNYGVKMSDPDSDHLLILNDDTCLTTHSLTNLVATANAGELAAVNPTSNCDQAWKYLLSFQLEKDGEFFQASKRFFNLQEIAGFEQSLIDAKSIYPRGVFLTDTLALYATLIPRKVWEIVGELDEQFKTGYEDSDWCHRARLKNIMLKIELSALIWHFGGQATLECLTDAQTNENKRKFNAKWHGG